ncbi:MAG: fluoride efflux transporter CrcB [Bacteroidota bacterium]
MLKNIIYIGIGGGLGSICRYLLSLAAMKWMGTAFPIGTFLINIIGSLLIGLFLGFFDKNLLGDSTRLLLITGFCGGFTTFSAFSSENLNLILSGNWFTAILYSLLSVLLGISAVWLGYKMSASF